MSYRIDIRRFDAPFLYSTSAFGADTENCTFTVPVQRSDSIKKGFTLSL
jgi:hypothetical protein